jgi:putative oxidoreductase
MRRLFSTFARGSAGVGLLLIRLVAASILLALAVTGLPGEPQVGPTLLRAISAGLGILLLAGLGTPIAGTLVALVSLWSVFLRQAEWPYSAIVGILGIALALLGPGAWSIDAHRFGWKRIEIPDRKKSDPPR